jgi:uncharacterized protein YndB with AHSA1/START domain
MIDIAEQINAVEREVGTRVFGPGEARTVTVTQTYPTTPDDVWDACTNPERIPRWFLPITGELKLGGKYQLEGNANGTVERCDPPKSFSVTWEMGDQTSWLEVKVVPEAEGKTRLQLEHIAHIDDDLAAQFGPGAVGIGWDLTLLGLARHLLPGNATITQAEAAEWSTSPEAITFMTKAAERWYEADVAAGNDPEKARAATTRVKAFYTTPPTETDPTAAR